jgi:hypothetical protein
VDDPAIAHTVRVTGSVGAEAQMNTAWPRTRRGGRRWIVAGILVATIVGLALVYSLWWSKPTAFGGVGNGFGFEQTTGTMHPVTVDMVQRPANNDAELITVNDVRPRVVANTADALITFAVCRRSEDSLFMSADGLAKRSCESLTEVEGRQVRLSGNATTTITMTVVPRRHGRVVIRGMEVDYIRGSGHLWQRGSEATGPVVRMRVSK